MSDQNPFRLPWSVGPEESVLDCTGRALFSVSGFDTTYEDDDAIARAIVAAMNAMQPSCRHCSKAVGPIPANDPEPDVCSSCAEAGELSGDSGGFGVETIGGGTEWFGTLDEAWSAMGPGRRVVTHG